MFADGVMESSNTLGTVDYVLTGAVYNGRIFGADFSNGDDVCYVVQSLNRSKYEIVRGVYQIGPPRKLTRAVILQSSQGGAKVNWTASDVYFISSFASATVLAGLIKGNLDDARPWWVKFGRWFQRDFPSAGLETEYLYTGANDIKLGVINPSLNTYESIFMPAGVVLPYAGATAPPGFILCRGQSLLRSAYPSLFAAIGTLYGSADGTHFNLPDTRERYLLGADTSSAVGRVTHIDASVLGTTGGDEDSGTTATTTGTAAGSTTGLPSVLGNASSGGGSSFNFGTDTHTHAVPSVAITATTVVADFPILPPTIVVNYIISTGGV